MQSAAFYDFGDLLLKVSRIEFEFNLFISINLFGCPFSMFLHLTFDILPEIPFYSLHSIRFVDLFIPYFDDDDANRRRSCRFF